MKSVSRREFLRLTTITLGASALAACAAPASQVQVAKDAVTVKGTVMAAGTVAPAAAVPAAGSKAGVLWGLQYDPHVETYNRLAKLFETKTGMTLKVEPQAGDLGAKVLAALAANTQPDVVCIMGKACVPLYMTRALLPLKDAVYAANGTNLEKDYFGDGLGGYAWSGDYYGVPMENGSIGNTVSVPVDDIKKLGLQSKYPPLNGNWLFESYDHLWECAKALQVEEGGKVKKWGLSSKGWDSAAVIGILRTYGEQKKMDWWDVDKQVFNVDTEEGVNALADYAERPVKKGIESEMDVTSVDAAMAGRAALARGNATPVVMGDTVGYNYEIAEVPPVLPNQKRPLTFGEGGWGFVTPRKSKNTAVAIAFLKLMDSNEGALEWEKIYGGKKGPRTALKGKYDHFVDQNPNSKSRRAAKFFDDHMMWESAKYYGEQMGYPSDIDKIFGEECSNIRTGKNSAADAAKVITERLKKQLAQFQDDVKRYKESA
jgi:ABC-type glycerol-3-phosphate transport system substrate-binding protein